MLLRCLRYERLLCDVVMFDLFYFLLVVFVFVLLILRCIALILLFLLCHRQNCNQVSMLQDTFDESNSLLTLLQSLTASASCDSTSSTSTIELELLISSLEMDEDEI